jgi:hypothetical protein
MYINPKKKPCKYCAMGNIPNRNKEHWIVTSIIPTRISVFKCTSAEPPAQPDPTKEE